MTASPSITRALVLGGGGAAGNAWQIGLIAGLADSGVDVTQADLVVGTSAGATVAAQATSGVGLAELYTAIVTAPPSPAGGAQGGPRGRAPVPSAESYLSWSAAIIAAAADPVDMRRRLGAAALAMDTSDGAHQARWRDVVAARLPTRQWPERPLLITVVDAETGEGVALDRHSGAELVDAVAASTSNGFGAVPPYRIGGRRYLDGGYRRNENADLARGHGRVLVLSPFGGRTRMPVEWGMDLATQVDELRAAGGRVETVFPDGAAGDVFNARAVDPSTRPQAARAGYDQGCSLAGSLADFWR